MLISIDLEFVYRIRIDKVDQVSPMYNKRYAELSAIKCP